MHRNVIKVATPARKISAITINTSKKLGSGSFATVYAGNAIDSQEELAVKVLTVKNQSEWEKCEIEIDIMVALTGPNAKNIVQIHGHFNDDDFAYIAMNYAENGALSDWLTGEKPCLSPQQQMEVTQGVAYGLAYMHSKNIIHCDIKSQNILLNNHMQALITDFGLSKRVSIENLEHISGTPLNFAPELLLALTNSSNSVCQNEKTDMYSFSLLCWCIVAQTPAPFSQIPEVSASARHIDNLIDWVVDKNGREPIPAEPQCPLNVAEVISLGWSVDPAKRPTAIQVLQKLSDGKSENLAIFESLHYATQHTMYKPTPNKTKDVSKATQAQPIDDNVESVLVAEQEYQERNNKSRCPCTCNLF